MLIEPGHNAIIGVIMRLMDRLKKEARKAATFRGHELSKFKAHSFQTKLASATCLKAGCQASVQVNTFPQPHEIDVGGTAVALDCPVDRDTMS
jgi:hypothetical protein